MRIAREIIETLRMELGFLKYKSPDVSVETVFHSIEVTFPTKVEGFEFDAPAIHDLHSSFDVSYKDYSFPQENENFVFKDIKDSIEQNIEGFCLSEHNLTVSSFDGLNSLNSNSSTIVFNEAQNLRFAINELNVADVEILNPDVHISKVKSVEVLGNDPTINGLGFKTPRQLFKVEFRKPEKFPPVLSSIDYVPAQYVEKSAILNAVQAISSKYNISLLKFYGYYRGIPLDVVSGMKILPNKNLRVFFDYSKVERLKRKQVLERDFIVFKYEDRFVYHLV
jgi:hypothetical protein